MKTRIPATRNRSDYKIGYGRPPEATQFKKGVSGNKKGRPKGTKNIATLFHTEMNQRVAITENGERRMITKAEAALKQLINKAAIATLAPLFFRYLQLGVLAISSHHRRPASARTFTLMSWR
jgi:Family of unknown function (DUF5681)